MSTAFPLTHGSDVPYGLMHESECKQQLSFAYIQAIATAARCSFEKRGVDYQGVDGTVHQTAPHDLLDTVAVDVQMKATSQDILRDDHLAFSLEKKYHEQLRSTRRQNPVILVVMIVPRNLEDWLTQSEDAINVAHAAYWMSIRNAPEIDTDSTTLHVPRKNLFGVDQLLGILARVGRGEQP